MVENPGQNWFRRNAVRKSFYVSAFLAAVAVAWIIYCVRASASWTGFVIGAVWLVLAAVWLYSAFRLRRRQQRVQTLPEADVEVLDLVVQGRKMEALRYDRAQHPEIGLREAKHIVDAL